MEILGLGLVEKKRLSEQIERKLTKKNSMQKHQYFLVPEEILVEMEKRLQVRSKEKE